MTTPIRLTLADHALVHGVLTLLAADYYQDPTERAQWQRMVQTALVRIMPEVTEGNPDLAEYIRLADELMHATPDQIHNVRSVKGSFVWQYHRLKLAVAVDRVDRGQSNV